MKKNIIVQASEMWHKENNLTYQELSNIGDAKVQLKVIIERLIYALEKYKRKPSTSEFHIKKQRELISELIKVQSILKFFLYFDYLITANELIINAFEQDNVIDGVIIKFLFNKKDKHFAYCTIGVGI